MGRGREAARAPIRLKADQAEPLATFFGNSVKLYDARTFELQQQVTVDFAIEEFALASGPTVVVGGKKGELAIID